MQIAEADDIAVGLDGVQNPVRPGKRLNQAVHFKIFVHPERVERCRVKACQEHIDHDEQIDLPRLDALGQVFVVILELVRRRVKIDVERLVIIDPEVFEMVQREMAKRGKGKKYHSGVHAFSTKIKCGECGSWYGSKVWHSNSKYRKTIWQCNHKFDGDCRCQTPHLTDEEIQLHFLSAANKLLATKAAVIANGREMQALLFDTTELEAEQAQLLEETQVVSDMVQQAIQENARTAQNQTEYQKRYDGLVQRFDRAKTRLEEVTAEIQEKQTASANMGAFLSTFEQMPDALTEFTLESWHSMVDFATVYSIDDIRFTFKNGQEIQA